MGEPKRDECKKCKEPIVWATTAKNRKRIALDAEPATGGKFMLEPSDEKQDEFLAVFAPNRYSGPRHTCHFETCSEK